MKIKIYPRSSERKEALILSLAWVLTRESRESQKSKWAGCSCVLSNNSKVFELSSCFVFCLPRVQTHSFCSRSALSPANCSEFPGRSPASYQHLKSPGCLASFPTLSLRPPAYIYLPLTFMLCIGCCHSPDDPGLRTLMIPDTFLLTEYLRSLGKLFIICRIYWVYPFISFLLPLP